MRSVTLAALAAACIALPSKAEARRHHQPAAPIQSFCGDRFCGVTMADLNYVAKRTHKAKRPRIVQGSLKRSARYHRASKPYRRSPAYESRPILPVRAKLAGLDSLAKGRGDLVEAALRFVGTNPTGWRSVWCGRFMAMIAPDAAKRIDNPNWARDWADLPKAARRVGAIAVLTRGRHGGGHIGVVAGFGKRGPILISGNTGMRGRAGRLVGIGEYDERRVLAYVKAPAVKAKVYDDYAPTWIEPAVAELQEQ